MSPGCQGCIGMGQAPGHERSQPADVPAEFPGRSGTKDDKIYLCSPGDRNSGGDKRSDHRSAGAREGDGIIPGSRTRSITRSIEGPSFSRRRNDADRDCARAEHKAPARAWSRCPRRLTAEVVLKVGDNISTDGIMPAGNEVLPFRSNIEALSRFVFAAVDPDFAKECRAIRGAVAVVGR